MATTNIDERLVAVRHDISQMEIVHAFRRNAEGKMCPERKLALEKQNFAPKVDGLPDLPPRLPRPEYVMAANLIGNYEEELRFYVACEEGLLHYVQAFVQKYNPSHAIRQYGLELASFAIQPDVARYLLSQNPTIHDGVFLRSPPGPDRTDISLFDRHMKDPLPMIKLFLEVGWHPNQLWSGGNGPLGGGHPKTPIVDSVQNKPLITLLLSYGADPRLSRHNVGLYDRRPLGRDDWHISNVSVGHGDTETIDSLICRGVDYTQAEPLHKVARLQGGSDKSFAERHSLAEHLLLSKIVPVDDLKYMTFPDQVCRAVPRGEYMTPFIWACAKQDWAFAEWLLEHGANPYLMSNRAFQPIHYTDCFSDQISDPMIVVDMVDRVRRRQGGLFSVVPFDQVGSGTAM